MTGASTTAKIVIPDRYLVTTIGDSANNGWDSSTNAASLSITPIRFVNVTQFRWAGNSVITGALPNGLTYLLLEGSSIAWAYTGALPTGLTSLSLSGNSIAWTALNAAGTGNISTFNIANHRITKMTDAELVILLNSMTARVGNLPATATIGDIANTTSTDAAVLAALANLLSTKGTTVTRQG